MDSEGLEEPAEESYFASISDLMIGVLFVFLLMLTVFALNFRDDSARLDELIQRAQQAEARANEAEEQAKQEALAEAAAKSEAERQAAEARQRAAEAAKLRQQNEAMRERL